MPLTLPARLQSFLARPALWWFAVFCWAAFLFVYCTFIARPTEGPKIPHLDKVFHFVYYAPGAACAALALALRAREFTTRTVIAAVALFALLGAADEFYQSFFPHRSGNDPLDWTADVLGAITGALVARKLFPFLVPNR